MKEILNQTKTETEKKGLEKILEMAVTIKWQRNIYNSEERRFVNDRNKNKKVEQI